MVVDTLEYRQGYSAFGQGLPFDWAQSPSWKHGWRAAKYDSAIQL